MYDIFISYSRADYKNPETGELLPNSPVSLVKELLDELGVRYWIDEKGIYSGSQFMNEIAEAIDQSRIFLFISTENSNKSQWVERELAFAVEQKKFILPIKAVDKYPPKISIWLAGHDYIDHYKQPKQTVARLKKALTRRLEEMRTREELEAALKRLSFEIAEQQKVVTESEEEMQRLEIRLKELKSRKEKAEEQLYTLQVEAARLQGIRPPKPPRKKKEEPAKPQEEITELRACTFGEALRSKHWLFNFIYILGLIAMAGLTSLQFYELLQAIERDSVKLDEGIPYLLLMVVGWFIMALGVFGVLKNQKSGFWHIVFVLVGFLSLYSFVYSNVYYDVYDYEVYSWSFVCLFLFLVWLPLRKAGKSAWSQLHFCKKGWSELNIVALLLWFGAAGLSIWWLVELYG